jgi:hypothetical protein
MDYFAGPDISMDETHVCVLDRVDGTGDCGRIRESAKLSSHRIRDGAKAGRSCFTG